MEDLLGHGQLVETKHEVGHSDISLKYGLLDDRLQYGHVAERCGVVSTDTGLSRFKH